jgi:membrane fusion protein, multidrug efflux system
MYTGRIMNLVIAIGIVIVSLLLNGCGKSSYGARPPGGGTPEVGVAVLQERPVTITSELPGRTSAYAVAEVRPQVNGIIQKRLFEEGSDVKVGDQLYQIDPAPYQAAYDNAKAALAKAEANLPSVRAKVDRYKELVEMRAISRQDYDDASSLLKQIEADTQVGKAAVETARINLGYTRIVSPITGRVGRSNVTVGALATAYQGSTLTTIQQLDPIYVDATESSANLLRLRKSMETGKIKSNSTGRTRVRLLLEDGTPYPIEGTLKFSDVTVDPTTGSFILRMVFPNPKSVLLPGMYVRAVIQEGIVEHGILAPQQGVTRDPKGNPIALVIDGTGKAEQRKLKIDRAIGDAWLVTEGLKAGDRVVVEGLQKTRPGSAVKVVSGDRNKADAGPAGPTPPMAPPKRN